MRVIHVCECLPGGPASYLQEILPYQTRELGKDAVFVIAPQSQVERLGTIAADTNTVTYLQERRDTASFFRLFRTILHSINTLKPDVLHLHSTIAGVAGRMAALVARHRTRTVYCAHGWMIDPDRPLRFRKLVTVLERMLTRITDKVVNISPHEPAFLHDYGFDPERMRLIVSGITDQSPPSVARRDTNRLNMLFIGRFDYQKGFDLLLEAIRHVPSDRTTLTIVGDAVRDDAASGDAARHIRYTGWLSREAVAQQVAEADVIVMPSRWEGLPLVALEAMRAGKPLIATDKGAFRHLIVDGVTGVLVDNEDPQFLRKVLERFDGGDFHRMGIEARCMFEAQYGAERMNRELLALYREIAA